MIGATTDLDNNPAYLQTYRTYLPGSGAEYIGGCSATLAPQSRNSKRPSRQPNSDNGFEKAAGQQPGYANSVGPGPAA